MVKAAILSSVKTLLDTLATMVLVHALLIIMELLLSTKENSVGAPSVPMVKLLQLDRIKSAPRHIAVETVTKKTLLGLAFAPRVTMVLLH
jgi:hypothetical protein